MADVKPLIIEAPRQGIAQSPYLGFANITNLDITSSSGVARLNWSMPKVSGSTVTALPYWIKKNPLNSSELYALDSSGQVYKSTNSGGSWSTVAGETAGGSGQGMEIWNDYLFVARASALDVYGPLSSSPSWSNSWKTIDTDSDWHPMLVSKVDGKLYGGAGRYVFSLEELTTFAPGTGATFTWTQQALDLPENYKIKSIAELGDNLMLGTWMGTNIYDFKVADIFPWDRASTSFSTPVVLSENGINAMLNVNNQLFVWAGLQGKVFLCNGVQAFDVAQIPNYISNLDSGGTIITYPGAVVNHNGRPFFGLSTAAAASIGGMGIWSLKTTSKGTILTCENIISTGSDGSSSAVKVGALLSSSNALLVSGWADASTYGIDKTDTSVRYSSYGGFFESPMYTVGTPLDKRQFTQGEFQLTQPLATGQGVKVKFRTDISASWTTIGTYDHTTLGAVQSHNFVADIPACEFLQIRCELTCNSNNASPVFRQLIFK